LDGEFDQSLSVSPKEIWTYIQEGGRVFGAASMGALRAVELDGLGMVGLGWVYDAYRSGAVIGDDEVALIYSPLGYDAVTIPLINVRYWLECLQGEGAMSRFRAARVLSKARKVHYTLRTADVLLGVIATELGHAELNALLRRTHGITNIKAVDAQLALQEVAKMC
jgi:hypothetical protein